MQHVHIHLLPRHPHDFEDNDDVYNVLEGNSQSKLRIDYEEREALTLDQMAAEAERLGRLFPDNRVDPVSLNVA
jgi:bis(5'-adenosyl)-triphosphatase